MPVISGGALDMDDLLMTVVTITFFWAACGLARFCERLARRG